MNMKRLAKESLQDKFHVQALDYGNRTLAGLLITDTLYIAKSHRSAINNYMATSKDSYNILSTKHAYLHIIDNTYFIDLNSILTNIPIDIIVNTLVNKYAIKNIYTYEYPNTIQRIEF